MATTDSRNVDASVISPGWLRARTGQLEVVDGRIGHTSSLSEGSSDEANPRSSPHGVTEP